MSKQIEQAAPYQLNVVVHGLWGIETNPIGIRMVTIADHHHVVKAGSFDPEFDLTDGAIPNLVLRGVQDGKPKDFDKTKNPHAVTPAKADPGKILIAVDVPYPRLIKSVRCIDTKGQAFFAPPFITPPELAMVQILVYDVLDLDALSLYPLSWTPCLNDDGVTVNLHLYAQPMDKAVPKYHFVSTFLELTDAFGLLAIPIRAANALPADPGVPGLKLQDMLALYERGTMAIGSPANCDMCIFDNKKR